MPFVMDRVRKFTAEHANSFVDPLPDILEGAFGIGDRRYVVIALVEDDEPLPDCIVGHVAAGVETYLGRSVCMVYQFEKDESGGDWAGLNRSLQALLENWCRSIGLDEIMIMAETVSRGRLFKRFGYEPGPVLMRRKFDG
jgi:hypothetical protein